MDDLIQARSTLQAAAEQWSEVFMAGRDPGVGLVASILLALTGYLYKPHTTTEEAYRELLPLANAAKNLAIEGLSRSQEERQVPS